MLRAPYELSVFSALTQNVLKSLCGSKWMLAIHGDVGAGPRRESRMLNSGEPVIAAEAQQPAHVSALMVVINHGPSHHVRTNRAFVFLGVEHGFQVCNGHPVLGKPALDIPLRHFSVIELALSAALLTAGGKAVFLGRATRELRDRLGCLARWAPFGGNGRLWQQLDLLGASAVPIAFALPTPPADAQPVTRVSVEIGQRFMGVAA